MVNYRSVRSPNLSVLQNCINVICKIDHHEYYQRPKSVAFHDLIQNQDLLQATKHGLGLSLKFIPIRDHLLSAEDMRPNSEKLDKDAHIKDIICPQSSGQ